MVTPQPEHIAEMLILDLIDQYYLEGNVLVGKEDTGAFRLSPNTIESNKCLAKFGRPTKMIDSKPVTMFNH